MFLKTIVKRNAYDNIIKYKLKTNHPEECDNIYNSNIIIKGNDNAVDNYKTFVDRCESYLNTKEENKKDEF